MKTEAAVLKSLPECCDELAAKDSAEHFDRKKECIGWLDPTRAIGRKSTGRHHTMYMRMKFELLTPSMQDTEEANFCTEMLGGAGDFEKRFGTGAKQEIVDDSNQAGSANTRRRTVSGVLESVNSSCTATGTKTFSNSWPSRCSCSMAIRYRSGVVLETAFIPRVC
jgi:hypothetical protein